MKMDQEVFGEIVGYFCMGHTQRNTSHPQAVPVNTAGETLMAQSSPSKNGEGKVEENIVAHDVADKYEIGRRNQTQEAMHKPCTASTPSKSLSI